MAKLSSTAITAADLDEYVTTQDDFALELFVCGASRTHGFLVNHGGTYDDPVTKKTRQYDIRACTVRDNRRIDLAIECKSLKPSYPLLLLRTPRSKDESFHQLVRGCEGNANFTGTSKPDSVRISPSPLYDIALHVGKATAQVRRNDGDLVSADGETFDKWSQALSSADELVGRAFNHHKTHNRISVLTLVIPVLVVSDGTLWAADFSLDGKLETAPHQVDEGLLFIGKSYGNTFQSTITLSHLHIFTKIGICNFLRDLGKTDSRFWESAFPEGDLFHLGIA